MSRISYSIIFIAALLFAGVGTIRLRSGRGAYAKVQVPPAYHRALWQTKYARPRSIPFPSDNPYSKDRERLGAALFFDPRLSATGIISCATCHNPGFSWSDALPQSTNGAKKLPRKAPTILNAAWADLLFWDGRAKSLEEQALIPITAPTEMNLPLAKMVAVVANNAGYQAMFNRAYPDQPITAEAVARAIATFERTIVSSQAPFDEWISGRESAISEPAKRGFDLFNTKATCQKCHEGWNFTDNGFHDTGLADDDPGRGALLPLEAMQHAFKTPTLRNLDRRGPYMHNGSKESVGDVIEFYDRGGETKRPSLDPDIVPLHLTAGEKSDLIEFLKTLTSDDKGIVIPVLPR